MEQLKINYQIEQIKMEHQIDQLKTKHNHEQFELQQQMEQLKTINQTNNSNIEQLKMEHQLEQFKMEQQLEQQLEQLKTIHQIEQTKMEQQIEQLKIDIQKEQLNTKQLAIDQQIEQLETKQQIEQLKLEKNKFEQQIEQLKTFQQVEKDKMDANKQQAEQQQIERQQMEQQIEQLKLGQVETMLEKTKNKYIFTYTHKGKQIKTKIIPNPYDKTILHCINIDTNELFIIQKTNVIPRFGDQFLLKTPNELLFTLITNYCKFEYLLKKPLTEAILWICNHLFSNITFIKTPIDETYIAQLTCEPELVKFIHEISSRMILNKEHYMTVHKFLHALLWEDTNEIIDYAKSHPIHSYLVPEIEKAPLDTIHPYIIDTMINVA